MTVNSTLKHVLANCNWRERI